MHNYFLKLYSRSSAFSLYKEGGQISMYIIQQRLPTLIEERLKEKNANYSTSTSKKSKLILSKASHRFSLRFLALENVLVLFFPYVPCHLPGYRDIIGNLILKPGVDEAPLVAKPIRGGNQMGDSLLIGAEVVPNLFRKRALQNQVTGAVSNTCR
jgi:hypothetical protein